MERTLKKGELKNKQYVSLKYIVYKDYNLEDLGNELDYFNKNNDTNYTIEDIKGVSDGKYGKVIFHLPNDSEIVVYTEDVEDDFKWSEKISVE